MCLSTRTLQVFILCIISMNAFSQENFFLSPKPKQIVAKQGIYSIGRSIGIYIEKDASAETRFACQQLIDELQKSVEVNFSSQVRKADIVLGIPEKANTVEKLLAETDLRIPKEGENEGYIIDISQKRILVTSFTEAGLFYGVQTLKQLIRGYEANLPQISVVDWPSLRYRGWMDDISRGPVPTVDFLKSCIRRMAEFKQNYFTLYTEHVFRLKNYPDIAPADGLTADEVNELKEYAARYHMEVVGNFQSFGHMAKILANPFYADLAESSDILNPANEKAYEFLKNVYSEIIPSYSSTFFNINCDETFGLGEGKSKQMAAEIGIDGIYAYHINRIDQLIKPYGKRIMMWGDIAVNNPGIIDKLPRDLIILSWGYHAADNFDDAILPFRNTGFDFMVAPGVSCWNEVWPGMSNAVVNISNYVRDGYKLGAMGMMNTAWDDNGHNLFNSNWHGLMWGAECSWNTLPASDTKPAAEVERNLRLTQFNKAFDKQFFKQNGVIEILLEIDSLRYLGVPGILNEWAFWSGVTDFNGVDTSEIYSDKNRQIIAKSDLLADRLVKILKANPENREMIENALFALKRIKFTAEKNLLRQMLFTIRQNKAEITANGSTSGSKTNMSAQSLNAILLDEAKWSIENLSARLFEIKKEYVSLWQRENRGWWLDKNLNDYNNLYNQLKDAGNDVFIEPAPGLHNESLLVNLYNLSSEYPIVYTLDGTDPSANSAIYNGTIKVNGPCLIKARTHTTDGLGPVTEKFITFHKGIGCLQKLNSKYSTYNAAYAAGGDQGLLDGLKGSTSFRDGRWQGYQGQDLDIQIDLKEKTTVSKISVDFLQSSYSWILLPKDVEIQTSDDGIHFKTLSVITHDVSQMLNETVIHNFSAEFNAVSTRYLRMIAHNPGPLPEAHHAAGNQSFIFADEIIVQ